MTNIVKMVVEGGVITAVASLPEGWTGAGGEWQKPEGSTLYDFVNGAKVGDRYDGETLTDNSAKLTTLPAADFIDRFTDGELAAIRNAATTDINVWKWVQKATSVAGMIDLESPNTVAGMEYLATQGHVTTARKTEILTP